MILKIFLYEIWFMTLLYILGSLTGSQVCQLEQCTNEGRVGGTLVILARYYDLYYMNGSI